MRQRVTIRAAVEGIEDEAVVRRIIAHAGGYTGEIFGKSGKAALRKKIVGYNQAAQRAPWLVLIDLDNDGPCAPPVCRQWVPHPAPYMCFRVAVRQVEAWLMADAEALAAYLGVARRAIPADPEALPNAKLEMVNIARRSRQRKIRQDMVPREGSGRSVGPAYASRLIEYAERHWRPVVAARRADSLRRTIDCLKRLFKRLPEKS